MEQAIAELPPDERRYGVRMRSMLASVLVPDHDPTRRLELADEAMAIAAETDEDELVGLRAAGPAARAVAARPARRAPGADPRVGAASPSRPATCSSS